MFVFLLLFLLLLFSLFLFPLLLLLILFLPLLLQAFNHDNYVVFNATLETLKQSLDQLEKNAVKLSTFHVGEEQVRDGNSKTENNNKASSFGGGFGSIGRFIGADSGLIDAGNGTIGDHWASSSSAAALAAGQGDAGRLNGSLFTGGGLTGMIDF